jgi:hypothetical protein
MATSSSTRPGMTAYPHAEAAGVRKAPRHEIAAGDRVWRCRGRYGDFDAGSGAYVTRSVGSAFNLSKTEGSGLGSAGTPGTFCGAGKCF